MSGNPTGSRLPSSIPPSLLFLIIDLHPLSWSLLAQPPAPAIDDNIALVNKAPATSLPIQDFLNALTVFLNAHLASAWGNDVVVYGASAGKSLVGKAHSSQSLAEIQKAAVSHGATCGDDPAEHVPPVPGTGREL
jgi:hypothetical protein